MENEQQIQSKEVSVNEKNMEPNIFNLNEDFDVLLHNGFDLEQHIFVNLVIN